jgi:hypothetical protein
VALHGQVIVPRRLSHERSLWWLRNERYPQLAVTDLCVLEEETGAQLGLSPYCVPVERWNETARHESWMPTVAAPTAYWSVGSGDGTTVLADSPRLQALPIPRQRFDYAELDRDPDPPGLSMALRLQTARQAVSGLFGAFRQVVIAGLVGAALLTCLDYLIAAAIWLGRLRDGMSGDEMEEGVVLILAALLLVAMTSFVMGRLDHRLSNHDSRFGACAAASRPVLDTLHGAYRIGIALQLLAFSGFVLW